MKYVLYSREGCSICQKAKAVLSKTKLEFIEVSIESDAQLTELYRLEIPVLVDENGKVCMKGVMSESRVAAFLAAN